MRGSGESRSRSLQERPLETVVVPRSCIEALWLLYPQTWTQPASRATQASFLTGQFSEVTLFDAVSCAAVVSPQTLPSRPLLPRWARWAGTPRCPHPAPWCASLLLIAQIPDSCGGKRVWRVKSQIGFVCGRCLRCQIACDWMGRRRLGIPHCCLRHRPLARVATES